MKKVFSSKKIGNIEIKNRITLPPLVTFTWGDKLGYVTDKKVEHYKKIAANGIGLIVVEATAINPNGRLAEDQLGIWDDKFIPGLKKIVDVIHKEGTKVFIQIHHAGVKTKVEGDIVSSVDYKYARGLSESEVKAIIQEFKQASLRAYKAGFDGVEVHGAHGYLLTQFFSKKVNQRNDIYGGSFENRIRIAKEIYQEINNITPKDFVIGIRMGANENSLTEAKTMAKAFQEFGFDYLSVSTGFDNTRINENIPEDFPGNWILYGGVLIKEVVDIPVIGVNKIKTKEQIKYLIDNNLLDFVAIGRAQLADYNFTYHLKNDLEILTCIECNPCKWRYGGENCPRQIQVRQKK
ncbi:MAG: NADH:flavin oxidoreductase [Bacillota bacterium]